MAERPASTARLTRWSGGVLAATALAGSLTYVGLVDPRNPGSLYPPCPFKLLTGWDCPGCGGIRMTHDLLHGQLGAAFADNAFLLAGLPALAFWWLWRRRQQRPAFPATVMVVLIVAAVGWTVVRNLPGFPLAPAGF